MLPAPHRLRRPPEFAQAVRRGRRAPAGSLVVHLAGAGAGGTGPARVGLVVGKVVGPAVVRNRVRRRLRELLRARLGSLPSGSAVVVRALPGAGQASFAALGADLDAALRRATAVRAGAGGTR